MIKSRTIDLSSLYSLSKNLETALRFIVESNLSDIEIGSNIKINDKIFYNCFTYNTAPIDELTPEVHKNFVDIHVLISGEEYIEISEPITSISSDDYDSINDSANMKMIQPSCIFAKTNDVIIIHPYEIHTPKIMVNSSVSVKKMVIKVPCDY